MFGHNQSRSALQAHDQKPEWAVLSALRVLLVFFETLLLILLERSE
jgi:hypothetical protein